MKNTLIDIGEGLIFGVAFAVLVKVLGIDVTPVQVGILTGFAILAIAVLNAVGTKLKGGTEEPLPDRQFKYLYGENTILVQYRGSQISLLINDEMQDMAKVLVSFKELTLTGKLPSGEDVKAVCGTKGINKWSVFVGQEELKEESR